MLVIDDSIPLLRVLLEGLQEFGHTTLGAQSGPEALAILEETPVDVVICDLGMPDMNGWDVGKAIRDIFEQGRTSTKIPFILLTGWASRLTPEEERAESCVDAILEKTCRSHEIGESGERTGREIAVQMVPATRNSFLTEMMRPRLGVCIFTEKRLTEQTRNRILRDAPRGYLVAFSPLPNLT